MDTTRSSAKVAAYLAARPGLIRETRTHSQRLSAPADAIFPLLCPTREFDWIPGWDCELLHTDSGYAELGVVFRTSDAAGERIWICDTYEPASRIGYVNFLPDLLMRLLITLGEVDGGSTDVTFSYTFISLNEAGNDMISQLPSGDADPHRLLPGLIDMYLSS